MSKFDWEAFRAGKIAVNCDTEEKAKAFLEECDERGIKWLSGEKATSYTNWTKYKKDTCYSRSSIDVRFISLVFSSTSIYKNDIERGSDIIGIVEYDTDKIIAKGHKKSAWTSVKDRLPKHTQKVLVYGYDDYLCTNTITIDKLCSDQDFLIRPRKYITHWMPLPEPPEEE